MCLTFNDQTSQFYKLMGSAVLTIYLLGVWMLWKWLEGMLSPHNLYAMLIETGLKKCGLLYWIGGILCMGEGQNTSKHFLSKTVILFFYLNIICIWHSFNAHDYQSPQIFLWTFSDLKTKQNSEYRLCRFEKTKAWLNGIFLKSSCKCSAFSSKVLWGNG